MEIAMKVASAAVLATLLLSGGIALAQSSSGGTGSSGGASGSTGAGTSATGGAPAASPSTTNPSAVSPSASPSNPSRASAERQSVESAGPHACQPAGSQQPYRPQSTGHANAAGTSEHHARGAPITDGACGAKNQRE